MPPPSGEYRRNSETIARLELNCVDQGAAHANLVVMATSDRSATATVLPTPQTSCRSVQLDVEITGRTEIVKK